MTNSENTYHALKIDTNVCFGCTHCMMKCPTGAIRIENGKATIYKDWCVDCAECMRACPVQAIYVVQDDFEQIFNYEYRVVLLPSVFIGQFSKQISEETIYSLLLKLGFTHVFQVEQGVPLVLEAMKEHHRKSKDKPIISAFCPAIVRLIQVRFPSLTNQLCLVKPPIDATALFYKKHLAKMGIPPEKTGFFYITPCAAKIAAIKYPVGEKESIINGVINMDYIYNKVYQHIKQQKVFTEENTSTVPPLSPMSMQWSLSHGEANHMEGRCLAIDEIHNVIEFLDRLETTDEIQNVDFLELRACDQSCAGGILLNGNRFLTVERLRKRAVNTIDKPIVFDEKYSQEVQYVNENIRLEQIPPRQIPQLSDNLSEALKKLQQVRNMMCYLPGIDCGACGAPNCQALAEDIAQHKAQLSNCIFLQRMMEKHRKLSVDHAIRLIEKTWGSDRLDKDCRKKGAKYEGM